MGTRRDSRIDRAYAERLLAGDPGAGGELVDVLAAASAPAGPHELRGEDAATAMFRAARTGQASHVPARRRPATTRSRRVATRFAVVVLVLGGLGAGGAAVAASTGVLPAVPHHHRATPGGSASPRFGRPASGSTPPTAPATGLGGPDPSTAGPASPSLFGLCHAYLAKVDAGRPTAADDARFARLATAVGGASNVATYCRALLASRSHGAGKGAPPHPTGSPATGRTGRPRTHPGGTHNPHASH